MPVRSVNSPGVLPYLLRYGRHPAAARESGRQVSRSPGITARPAAERVTQRARNLRAAQAI